MSLSFYFILWNLWLCYAPACFSYTGQSTEIWVSKRETKNLSLSLLYMSFSTCTRRRGVEIWWIGQGVVWVCLSMHLYIKQRQLTVSSCCVYACTVSLAWTRRRIEIWGRRCCTCAVMRQTRCWDLSSSLLYAYCFSCTRRRGDEISVRRSYNVLFQLYEKTRWWDLSSSFL